jgi:hypothetical protein
MAEEHAGAAPKGGDGWLSQQAKDNLFLAAVYIAMLLGMGAKTLFDYFTRDVPLVWKGFLLPLIVSPLIYGSVYTVVQG